MEKETKVILSNLRCDFPLPDHSDLMGDTLAFRVVLDAVCETNDCKRIDEYGLNPLAIDDETYLSILPTILALALRFRENAIETFVAHTFLYQIFEKRLGRIITRMSRKQRNTLWTAINFVYESILDLKDDPYWIENKKRIKNALQ